MFLEGDAFLVFYKLSDLDKQSLAKVTGKLKGSSHVSKVKVYKFFISRQACHNESIDAYTADLHCLASLTGLAVDDEMTLT